MRLNKRWGQLLALVGGLAIGLWISGCLSSSVTCTQGLKACGNTCSDTTTDKANCGGCGIACQVGQLCQDAKCVCEPGAVFCNGACVATDTDPNNCGGCAGDGGTVCGAGDVCEGGQCKPSCTLGGSTVCGSSCVSLQNDPDNCGACGNVCASGQGCHAGVCAFDAVGACLDNGEVVGLSVARRSGGGTVVGTNPQALAVSGGTLLVGDALDGKLRQVRSEDFGLLVPENDIGTDPQGILSSGSTVYEVSGSGNALNVFVVDGGTSDAGVPLAPVGGYAFPADSNPHGVAKVGDTLFVPQYGCWAGTGGCTDPQLSNFVARLDVTNPGQPADAGILDLSGLVSSFDGGTTYARPSAVAVLDGGVYVALGNQDAMFNPVGPGVLARIDPSSGAATAIPLPAACLSPFALATSGADLVVSCAGASDYSTFPNVTTSNSALVLVQGDQPVATYQASCPADSDGGCLDVSFGRIAARDGVVFAADQSQGRVFVVAIDGGSFQEVHGYQTDGPIVACTNADGGSFGQVVQDVVAVP